MDIQHLYSLYGKRLQITTDSRSCPQGSIFIALKGEHFDGNLYAAKALEQGCSYAVVDNPACADTADERYILVDNALQAFKQLARNYRREFNIPVIGITGTNGKTTTKELVTAVLRRKYRVMATEGNFNNDVGVPKTLLRLTDDDQMAVVEMGASHPGDIRTLAETAEPTCGLITNVGMAHLEGFGSFEGVKRTKGELYDFLVSREGASEVFINADDADLTEMFAARRIGENGMLLCCAYSTDEQKADYVRVLGKVVECNPYVKVAWKMADNDLPNAPYHTVQTQLVGAYNISNVLAAVTVGLHFGVDQHDISAALEAYQPTNNRSQFVDTGRNHLIVDAYNANPVSMMAAINNFDSQVKAEKKMVILGDMGELGRFSTEAHQRVADRLKELDMQVWLVGKQFGQTQHKSEWRTFDHVEQVIDALTHTQIEGYTILIKASNSMRLMKLKDVL